MAKKKKPSVLKKNWKWNQNSWEGGYRYDGVNIEKDGLLWYTETYPAFAGGGAHKQTFFEFLKNGPSIEVPKEILDEIYESVKSLEQTEEK